MMPIAAEKQKATNTEVGEILVLIFKAFPARLEPP